MRQFQFILAFVVAVGLNTGCTGQSERNNIQPVISEAGSVEEVYFHNARRCVTCKAVESVSEDAVAELYGGKVPFFVYNMDTDEGKKRVWGHYTEG